MATVLVAACNEKEKDRGLPSELEEKLMQMLFPAVEVFVSGKLLGSGAFFYSGKCGNSSQTVCTFAVTNYHVIESIFKAKNDLEKDLLIRSFVYDDQYQVVGKHIDHVTLVAYDSKTDLAILQIEESRKVKHVAHLAEEDFVLFPHEPAWAVGSAKARWPTITEGHVATSKETRDYRSFDENRDGFLAIRVTAQTAEGSSGGAVYVFDERDSKYKMIGVSFILSFQSMSDRMYVDTISPINFMTWAVPASKLRELMKKTGLDSILKKLEKKKDAEIGIMTMS